MAEQELKQTLICSQIHVLSRAASVETCSHYAYLKDDMRFKHYALPDDILFPFGKSGYADMSGKGHKEMGLLRAELQQGDAQIKQVKITGHRPVRHGGAEPVIGRT